MKKLHNETLSSTYNQIEMIRYDDFAKTMILKVFLLIFCLTSRLREWEIKHQFIQRGFLCHYKQIVSWCEETVSSFARGLVWAIEFLEALEWAAQGSDVVSIPGGKDICGCGTEGRGLMMGVGNSSWWACWWSLKVFSNPRWICDSIHASIWRASELPIHYQTCSN